MQANRFHDVDGNDQVGTGMTLKRGELASIRVWPGQVVVCDSGSVWITVDRDGHDHVLNGGSRQSIDTRGCMVIEALLLPQNKCVENKQRSLIMNFVEKAAPHAGNPRIWKWEFNKDSAASALVLAASLFILLFVSASAAVQSAGAVKEQAVAPVNTQAIAASREHATRILGERVFNNIDMSAKCRSAKLC